MTTIIVTKKNGHIFTGDEIAEAHWISERNGNIYVDRYLLDSTHFITDPVDKFAYLTAELAYTAENAARKQNKEECIAILDRIENLDSRLIGYIPYATEIDRWDRWNCDDLPEYFPRLNFGRVEKGQEGLVSSFLEQEGIDDFDFILDSKYVLVIETKKGMWDNIKTTGLVNLNEIESEYRIEG